VPYIGDLLGVRGLIPVRRTAFSQRVLVANTLGYRRRKGTSAMLEQLARDVSGWPAKAVEFFELLAATQYLNHLRPGKGATVDLRDTERLELLNSPFERLAHSIEVRHIDTGRDRYHIPHLGLFLWRLESYALTRATARPAAEPADGRYRFTPLGHDLPLFNRPRTEAAVIQLAAEKNLPGPLRRRPLYDELEASRQALLDNQTPRRLYFGDPSVLQVFVDSVEVPPDKIVICDLSDPPTPLPGGWRRPAATKRYTPTRGGLPQDLPIDVAVDPVLGRLAFPLGVMPDRVEVSYSYGFSGDLGGGTYDRRQTLADPREATWIKTVGRQASGADFDSLTAALLAWADPSDGNKANAILTLMDNASYTESPVIELAEGRQLVIQAANGNRPNVRLVDAGGQGADLSVTGGKSPTASLTLNGLLIVTAQVVYYVTKQWVRNGHCNFSISRGNFIETKPQHIEK
jgi:hypothetical protein